MLKNLVNHLNLETMKPTARARAQSPEPEPRARARAQSPSPSPSAALSNRLFRVRCKEYFGMEREVFLTATRLEAICLACCKEHFGI